MKLQDKTLGIIGGGQLGRMLCMVARRMDIKTLVWTGGLEAPASVVADEIIDASFDDLTALENFCAKATHATVEFENIPRESLQAVANQIPLNPSPEAISICQHREREKLFLQSHSIPCAPFAVIANLDDLKKAVAEIGPDCVLKTAAFGYDGKGQLRLHGGENLEQVWKKFSCDRAVLEGFVPFTKELSVMISRDQQGSTKVYDPAENEHRHHMLDMSIVPARIETSALTKTKELATQIAEAMNYVGIMGVEFFLLEDGSLLVNEMAPRPHNSGHHTIDACQTSQFEQQLRAVLDLPLGSPNLLSPTVMLNLLGDMWTAEDIEPDWLPLFSKGNVNLHLYGKSQAVGRRKMGHATVIAKSVEEALEIATKLKTTLLDQGKGA